MKNGKSPRSLVGATVKKVDTYRYDGDRMLSFNGTACTYDDMGCPTEYRGHMMEWNELCRPTKYVIAADDEVTYTHNAAGRRTAKKHNAEAEIAFTYDSNGKLLMQSNGISFLYDHAGIAGITYDGNTYLYRKNAQGDVIALFDTNGAVVATYTYDAWGNCEVCPTAVIDNNRKSEYDKTVANLNPIRYRSYYFDTETEPFLVSSRYYDPETGRFISPDDISYLDPESIGGLNLYAYCLNNPVMYADPTGHDEAGVKQYRFFDAKGNAWFDKDFRHGGANLKYPHYHGWINGIRLGGHWSFWDLIKWLF